MKPLYLIMLAVFPTLLYGQSGILRGKIVDEATGNPVEYGIVLEYSRQQSIYSDRKGEFTADISKGDTLVVSALGYYYCKVLVSDSLLNLEGTVTFKVSPRLYEITEARIVSLGTYDDFRHNFINLKTGNENTERLAEHLTASSAVAASEGFDKYQQNRQRDGVTIMSVPIRGPEERERIRLAKIIEREKVRDRVYERFNPELIKKVTGLNNDDDIIEFMVFCDFTEKYLLEVEDDLLIAQIRMKYDAFKIRKQTGKAHLNPMNLNSDTNNPNV